MTSTALHRLPDGMVHQRRAMLERALHTLEPIHQNVIMFKFFAHLSTHDIATTLYCSEASVRVLQYQALAELQRVVTRVAA